MVVKSGAALEANLSHQKEDTYCITSVRQKAIAISAIGGLLL